MQVILQQFGAGVTPDDDAIFERGDKVRQERRSGHQQQDIVCDGKRGRISGANVGVFAFNGVSVLGFG